MAIDPNKLASFAEKLGTMIGNRFATQVAEAAAGVEPDDDQAIEEAATELAEALEEGLRRAMRRAVEAAVGA